MKAVMAVGRMGFGELLVILIMLGLPVAVVLVPQLTRHSERKANGFTGYSDKSKGTAAVLCFFFGAFGAHRFYAGKVGTGILYLFTGGVSGIGCIVDFILILCGVFDDGDGLPIE